MHDELDLDLDEYRSALRERVLRAVRAAYATLDREARGGRKNPQRISISNLPGAGAAVAGAAGRGAAAIAAASTLRHTGRD